MGLYLKAFFSIQLKWFVLHKADIKVETSVWGHKMKHGLLTYN